MALSTAFCWATSLFLGAFMSNAAKVAFFILTLDATRRRPSVVHATILSVPAERLDPPPPGKVRVTVLSMEGEDFCKAADGLHQKLQQDPNWSWAAAWLNNGGQPTGG